jgi:DNA-binding CsgD family transcriptional regulator
MVDSEGSAMTTDDVGHDDDLDTRIQRELDRFHWSIAGLLLRSSSLPQRALQAQLCEAMIGTAVQEPCVQRRRASDHGFDPTASPRLGVQPATTALSLCLQGVSALVNDQQRGLDQLVAAHHVAWASGISTDIAVHPTDLALLVAVGLDHHDVADELLSDACTALAKVADCSAMSARRLQRWVTLQQWLRSPQRELRPITAEGHRTNAGNDIGLVEAFRTEAQRLITTLCGERRVDSAATLSAREREIGALIIAGHTHKEIGCQLYLAAKTVEHNVARMRQRLGALNRAEFHAALRHQGL